MRRLIKHALIMAAGRGNRMRPLTDELPKPMVPVGEDTLIGNSLKMLKERIPYIHVTVGYKKAMLSQYLMNRGVSSVFNTEGHNNAWWVANTVMRYIDEPVLVLTTDNITELDMAFLEAEYLRLKEPYLMLVPVEPIAGVEGDFIECDENGVVHSIQRNQPSGLYCSGIQVLNPVRVNRVSKSENFYTLWSNLIAKGVLKASMKYPKTWFSVDTLEHLARVSR